MSQKLNEENPKNTYNSTAYNLAIPLKKTMILWVLLMTNLISTQITLNSLKKILVKILLWMNLHELIVMQRV